MAGVLAMAMLLPRPALAQDEDPFAEPSPSLDGQITPSEISSFDRGQETPMAPVTPAPGPASYPDAAQSSRFLLGDAFGLRPLFEERGFSFYASSTQFEQGVASGGVQQAFRWGGKFDLLAHLDSEKLGLWDGGFLDLFAESRLGQSIDGFSRLLFSDQPRDVLPGAQPGHHRHHGAEVHAAGDREVRVFTSASSTPSTAISNAS